MLGTKRVLVAVAVGVIEGCGGEKPTGPAPPPPPPPTRLVAEFKPGNLGFYYGPPTLVGGAVYAGTSRGIRFRWADTNAFYKLTAAALAKVWEFPLGAKEVRGGAALDPAGNVYFFVEEGRGIDNSNPSTFWLYSLDPSGTLRWTKEVRRTGPTTGMNNPAIATDGTIYILGDYFYAYAPDGSLRWRYREASAYLGMNAPIIDQVGNLYFSASGSVVSLSPSGTKRWSVATTGEYFSSPAFSVDQSKIFVGVGNRVLCLASATGAVVWTFTPAGNPGTFRATPAVDDADNVYLGTKGDSLSTMYAIKADGSGTQWERKIGRDLYSSPAIGTDRTLYFGAEGAKLWALDLATGAERWHEDLHRDATWSSPAVADDGSLYLGSMDLNGDGGAVYRFRTDSRGLLRGAGSPRFHGGNASTGRRER